MNLLDGVTGFEWDEANIAHIARHNVSPEEAEEVFKEDCCIRFLQEEEIRLELFPHATSTKRG